MKLRSREIGPFQNEQYDKSNISKNTKKLKKSNEIQPVKSDYFILKKQWDLYNIFLIFSYMYLFFIVTIILYGLDFFEDYCKF